MPEKVTWRKNKIGFEPPQEEWMKHKAFIDRIHQAKQQLARAGILKKEMVDKSVRSTGAYSAQNYDWRYLVAASLFAL